MTTKTVAFQLLQDSQVALEDAFRPMPDAALAWLKPGDDYALGGIVIHLIGSLDGYLATLDALHRAGYRDAEGPAEDEAVVEASLSHARRGLTSAERESVFTQMRAKRALLATKAARASDDEFPRLVGIHYPGDEAPYPTSVALVVQWMTEHFTEHVPHAQQLYTEWRSTH
jgi:hypothetical protein